MSCKGTAGVYHTRELPTCLKRSHHHVLILSLKLASILKISLKLKNYEKAVFLINLFFVKMFLKDRATATKWAKAPKHYSFSWHI